MKGSKMKLRRILAAIIAASAICHGASAFTPYGPEIKEEPEAENSEVSTEETEETEAKEEEDTEQENVSDDNPPADVIHQYRPNDYIYRMFEQILDAYVEKHLYEFTEEEVLHKFFEDFLKDNPMYFSYFMEYILGTMDPYSSYYNASSKFLDPESESTGFGFTIKDSENGVFIESVIPDSNASDAGFMPGDRFVSIAGINVENHTFDVVTTLLAKPQKFIKTPEINNTEESAENENTEKDTIKTPSVEITVDRNGEKHTFSLERGPMRISQVSSTVDPNHGAPAAFIDVQSFLGDGTDTEFCNLVKKYADDGIKHLTIDLRNNGGGSLDYALSMVEIFLDEGELICYYSDKSLEEPQPVYSTNGKISFDSITILINENTASAAELFTSILKDKGLAKVVGKKSFGKSLGQEVYTLITGDYITITTYQMLNEKKESYDGIGIFPDLEIDEVEMCYTLPELGVFNHQNYVEIKDGEYSDVTKALEDRLFVMGVLRKQYCDGVFDDMTKTALFVLQTDHDMEASGYVDYKTVSLITRLINSYKTYNYYDNTQYDVAMIIHRSFSQGKRLVNEKEKLREQQAEMIKQRDAAIEAALEAEDKAKEKAEDTAKSEITE